MPRLQQRDPSASLFVYVKGVKASVSYDCLTRLSPQQFDMGFGHPGARAASTSLRAFMAQHFLADNSSFAIAQANTVRFIGGGHGHHWTPAN